jgi:endonuclease YncB( thermonuclease family)
VVHLECPLTPERDQAFGTVSRNGLADLVAGKSVDVQEHDRDRYGRTIGVVTVAGKDVNLAQLRAGLAWVCEHYISGAPSGIAQRYRAAEESARKGGIGLWREGNPVPPWVFRRGEGRSKTKASSVQVTR